MNRHWFDYARGKGFGDIHFHNNPKTGLSAIISIHSTTLGPALGGCRVLEYESIEDAIQDSLRLARAMSFKAAMVGLPQGGGKAVLLKPKEIKNREAYFKSFGRFVNSLNGQYITAIDSGSTVQDMDWISTETPYVTSTSKLSEDTSLYTAQGVFIGLKRAMQIVFETENLSNKKVAIQGVGHVGYYLAKLLHNEGVELFITDVNQEALERTKKDTQATIVGLDEIYDVECDVFSPCALGATINEKTLPRIQAKIIAGAANNQLTYSDMGQQVYDKGIYYVPDYVLNAGGLIYCSCKYNNLSDDSIKERLENIANSVEKIYEQSRSTQTPSNKIVDVIAEQIIANDS